MDIWGRRVGMQIYMDYCDRLARVLFDAGVLPMRAPNITMGSMFMGLYGDFTCKMVSLM